MNETHCDVDDTNAQKETCDAEGATMPAIDGITDNGDGTPVAAPVDANEDEVVILVLGDGDFSWSYDMARHLIALADTNAATKTRRFHLLATGFDSLEALTAKYKVAPFLLRQMELLNASLSPLSANNGSVRVSIHHGINAIQSTSSNNDPGGETDKSPLPSFDGAHHVIFHHPHLGTEDAALHARFLCHLFHSVSNRWMKKRHDADCNFHVTLVKGQYERWQCLEAARHNHLVLVNQSTFRSPRVPNPYYQHRRHQTGKSFASRAPEGSITYTFARSRRPLQRERQLGEIEWRKESHGSSDVEREWIVTLLDLVADDGRAEGGDCDDQTALNRTNGGWPCPHCERSFREERSQGSHIQAVHVSSDDDKKRKRAEVSCNDIFSCSLCLSRDGSSPRIFSNAQALQDHVRAKHAGDHTYIPPDWHKPSQVSQQKTAEWLRSTVVDSPYGSCDICGCLFKTNCDGQRHVSLFSPSDAGVDANRLSLCRCSYCNKVFRERRARQQHENFCSSRITTTL